jgi:hypothetical protein
MQSIPEPRPGEGNELSRIRKAAAEIEGKAEELRALARQQARWTMWTKEAEALDRKAEAMLRDLYKA